MPLLNPWLKFDRGLMAAEYRARRSKLTRWQRFAEDTKAWAPLIVALLIGFLAGPVPWAIGVWSIARSFAQ